MIKQQLFDTIEAYENIIICRHERPDPDAIGSQAGLARMIEKNSGKKVLLAGEEEASLTFLAKMDNIDDSQFEKSLIIICDTANTGRIDDQRYQYGKKILKVDHHPEVDHYTPHAWVDTTFSSTCEMIVHWYETVAAPRGWELDEECARLLFAGIVGDTGRFLHPNTSTQTLRSAQFLLEREFDVKQLYEDMYKKPLSLLRLEGQILQNFTLSTNGVGIIVLTQEQLKKHGISVNDSSALVHSVAAVEGLLAWITFVELEDGGYRVRLRSKGPVINELAAEFKGGGHPLAAGARAENKADIEVIRERLEKICAEYRQEIK